MSGCGDHHMLGMDYLAKFEDAEARDKRGERQYQCDECRLWVWPRRRKKSPPAASSPDHRNREGRT